jgi:hypothetical protein
MKPPDMRTAPCGGRRRGNKGEEQHADLTKPVIAEQEKPETLPAISDLIREWAGRRHG